MRIKKNKNTLKARRSECIKIALICTLAACPLGAVAAPWEYGAIVDLGVIHSDNIRLDSGALKESETVYTITPEFFLTTNGDRIDADIRYRPEAYFFSKISDADDVFHVLDASLTGALVKDRLFVFLGASNFQAIISPEGQIPSSNIPISTNRTDSRTLEVRPYWQQRIGQANALVEVGYRDVDYDNDLFQSSNQRTGHVSLNNIERQQGLAWGIDYQHRRVEYETATPFDFQRASLNLGFWINGNTRLFAEGGAESSIDNLFENNLDAEFAEVGFQYKPNQRLDLEMAVGDRSYGTSFRGNFSYQLRRGTLSLTYTEGPEARGELAFGFRPIADTDDLDNILNEPGDTDRFLRRRGEFGTVVTLSKSELTFRVFAERRELRTRVDGTQLDNEELTGAAARWSWDIGTKTTLGFGVDIVERDGGGRDTTFTRGQIDLAYNFAQRMSIRLEGGLATQDSGVSGNFGYDENQVRLLLRAEF